MDGRYKPTIRIIAETGNPEAIKRSIIRTLKREGESVAANEFKVVVSGEKNYDKIIEKAKDYVELKTNREK